MHGSSFEANGFMHFTTLFDYIIYNYESIFLSLVYIFRNFNNNLYLGTYIFLVLV